MGSRRAMLPRATCPDPNPSDPRPATALTARLGRPRGARGRQRPARPARPLPRRAQRQPLPVLLGRCTISGSSPPFPAAGWQAGWKQRRGGGGAGTKGPRGGGGGSPVSRALLPDHLLVCRQQLQAVTAEADAGHAAGRTESERTDAQTDRGGGMEGGSHRHRCLGASAAKRAERASGRGRGAGRRGAGGAGSARLVPPRSVLAPPGPGPGGGLPPLPGLPWAPPRPSPIAPGPAPIRPSAPEAGPTRVPKLHLPWPQLRRSPSSSAPNPAASPTLPTLCRSSFILLLTSSQSQSQIYFI